MKMFSKTEDYEEILEKGSDESRDEGQTKFDRQQVRKNCLLNESILFLVCGGANS